MTWSTPFIVYRISKEGKLYPVYTANDLKDAKYWLSYIAEVGDALFKTPAHPNYSNPNGLPEYWSHKVQSGQPIKDQSSWLKHADQFSWDKEFQTDGLPK